MHETKVILGVTCTVVHLTFRWSTASSPRTRSIGTPRTRTGNVWYFGEDTKAFENGQVSTEGSVGGRSQRRQAGDRHGGHPQVGDSYRQEFAAGVAGGPRRGAQPDRSVSVYFRIVREPASRPKDLNGLDPNDVENKYYWSPMSDRFWRSRFGAAATARSC